MRLRFLGPCECSIYIAPDAVVGGDEGYLKRWQTFVDAHAPQRFGGFALDEQSFAHSRVAFDRRPIRYESAKDDTPFLPPHIFTSRVSLDADTGRELRQLAAERLSLRTGRAATALAADGLLDIATAHVRVYYGGIMSVWFDTRESGQLPGIAELEIIERSGIAMLQVLAEWIDARLRDAFAGHPAQTLDSAPLPWFGRSSARSAPQWETMPRGPALWVARSLIVDRSDTGGSAGIREWLAPVSSNDLEPLLPEDGFRMEWMRYAFDLATMDGASPSFEDAWESMLFSQFYWATLERIEFQMFRVLGRIDGTTDTAAVRESYAALGKLREAAELTLVHHRYQMRYLARVRHRVVGQILKGWGFDELVENLREVIEIARVRHEQLLQRASARGNLVTDLLLFAIGSVALLDFFVGLTVVGRQLASDSSIGRRDEGWFGLVDLVSGWRVNDVLSIATLFVVIALLLIARYRHRRPF